MFRRYKIGILSLQGGFKEVNNILSLFEGIVIKYVNNKNDLDDIDALILPGGESSTIMNLINETGLKDPIINFFKTKPVYGICAGLILLTDLLELSISLERNYFGRQTKSFFDKISLKNGLNRNLATDVHFIRAPGIINVGDKDIEVLDNELS